MNVRQVSCQKCLNLVDTRIDVVLISVDRLLLDSAGYLSALSSHKLQIEQMRPTCPQDSLATPKRESESHIEIGRKKSACREGMQQAFTGRPICTMHSKSQQGTATRNEEGVRGKWAPFALQTVWTGCVGTARLLAVLATMLLLSLLGRDRF